MIHRAMIPLSVLTVVITLLAASQPAGVITPIGPDFAAWRPDTGTWFAAGGAKVDPADEKLLKGEPGTGVLINGPDGKTKHLLTKEEFGDLEAHIEFMVAKESNSGVYFQGRYEIQILDSYGVANPTYTDCGGIYQRWDEKRDPMGYEGTAPKVNASLPPGQWQTFDVIFRAPKFDGAGKKIANAKFEKVVFNGKVIHENVELTGPTRASRYNDEAALGPLMIQGDHARIWIRKLVVTPITGR